MKITPRFLVIALYASSSTAILGFGKSAYNNWHETELERWLSDHDIPYPTPADRNDLEILVKQHWDCKVSSPYNDWDTARLQAYLHQKGVVVTDKSKENKNWLIEVVKKNWYEAENVAEDAYENVKNWIFDTWTDSQLKAFLDRHGVPNPTPKKRGAMLQVAKENYQTIADKVGETSAYPGNWLYEAWSESELKKWLDEHGIPVPQPTTRDKLIAQVRRNSRTAALKLWEVQASASKSAQAAKESITDTIFDTWSNSELKKWCDKNSIKVPQGSTRSELIALARRNKAFLSDDTINASMSAYYDSATNTVASASSKATDTISDITQDIFDKAIELWSDTRLKAYLDSRGVPLPQNGKRDELLAKVRLHRHKIANGYGTWTFDTWTYENLKKYVDDQANKGANAASSAASTTREELLKQAQKAYDEAKSSGGSAYASVTSAMAKVTDSAKLNTFEAWSNSDLKNYLDSYGIKTYQGTTRNELLAKARRTQRLFWYGTATPTETMYEKIKNGAGWLYNQAAMKLGLIGKKAEKGVDFASESAQHVYDMSAEKSQEAKHMAEEKAKYAYDKAYEQGQKVYHKEKEEL